jgi:hypothetical protein
VDKADIYSAAQKPITPKTLLAKVRAVLDGR